MPPQRKRHVDFSKGTVEEQAKRLILDGLRAPVENEQDDTQEVRGARTDFLRFIEFTFPGYKTNWHHRVIAERLQRWVHGKRQRLILVAPSRHGKTELVSRRLPAYLFGVNPDAELIASSYAETLTADNNRDVQSIIDSERYQKLFPKTQLYSANIRTVAKGTWLRNSSEFQIVGHRGHYRCAGVGSGLAGKGAEYLILDDPHKDYVDACSAAMRSRIWNWFTSVFYQRRNTDDANILVTATRWVENDLIGMLLELAKQAGDSEQWEVMRFPIEGEHPDPAEPRPWDERAVGEPLDRRVRDEKAIAIAKAQTPPIIYAAMYVGKPTADQGNLVKRDDFQLFSIEKPVQLNGQPPTLEQLALILDISRQTFVLEDLLRDGTIRIRRFSRSVCRLFQVCDTAQTVSQSSDWTVIMTCALTPESDLLILNVDRDKLEIPHQYPRLLQARALYPDLIFQAVEEKSSGIGLIQQGRIDAKPFKVLKADGNKAFRAADVTAMYHARKVYHLNGAPWLEAYLREMLAFPNGSNDDQWDAAAYAGILVRRDELLRTALAGDLNLLPDPAEWGKIPLDRAEDVVNIGGHDVYVGDDEKPWYE